ncbi:hypothetical protein KSS87_015210, partial [Heliosperma pusillum]
WKDRAKLPPGSLGWPYIGETPQLFSQNPHDFFINREKRYGDVFKSHILGCPCIMLASPEAIKFVLMTKANLFKPTYPKSKERLIGKSAIFFQQGGHHVQIRKLVQASLSLDAIKPLVSDIQAIAKSTLDSWAHCRQIHTFHELKKVILESLRMASIISFTYREAVEDVVYNGYLIPKGWKVLPLFRNIHHNSTFFEHPQIFDASRFEAGKKPHVYMPFGYGSHACPGNEVAKLMILIFIHHLLTEFRWEVVGSNGGVQYLPFPVPEKGLPAKFWRILLNYS